MPACLTQAHDRAARAGRQGAGQPACPGGAGPCGRGRRAGAGVGSGGAAGLVWVGADGGGVRAGPVRGVEGNRGTAGVAAAARPVSRSPASHPERVLHPARHRRRLLADPERPRIHRRRGTRARMRGRGVHGRHPGRAAGRVDRGGTRPGHRTDRRAFASFGDDPERTDAERRPARAQHGRGTRQRAVRRGRRLRPDRPQSDHQVAAQLLHLAVAAHAQARRRRGAAHVPVHPRRPRASRPPGNRRRSGPARRDPAARQGPVARRHRSRGRHPRAPPPLRGHGAG